MIGKYKRKDRLKNELKELRDWIVKLETSHFLGRLGPVVIAGFIVIIATLALLDIRAVFEPPLLLFILNTLFLSIVAFIVAYMSATSYLAGGSVNLLFLGCGVLVLGATSPIAGWLIHPPGGPNVAVTIYNIGALVASAFHFVGVALAPTSQEVSSHRRSEVILAYLGVLIFMALLTVASLRSAVPPFFIQGAGPTLLRQVVLGAAVALFAISSLLFLRLYFMSKSDFLYWYSVALALIAVGLSGVLLQKSVGCPIGWAGRSAQYLGGICFFMAVLTTIKGARIMGMPLERAMSCFFREAEEFCRALVETVTDAIISIDHEGRILLWNSAADKTFGYSRDEAVGSLMIDLIIPDQCADSMRRAMENLAKTGSGPLIGKTTEMEAKKKDGQVFPVEFSVSATNTADGWRSTIIARDVTKRKQMEDALRESEEKYRSLVESTEDSIYLVDRDCRYLFVNKKHLSRFGLPRDKVIGRTYGEFHFEEEAREFAGKVKEVFETGESLCYEYKSEGDGRYFLRTLSPAREPDEGTAAVTVVSKNITEHKRAEEELRESEEKYRTILESIEEGYYEVDLAGNLTFFNDSICNILGYARDELIGMNNRHIMDQENAEKVYETFNRVYTTGEPAKGSDWDIMRKDGTKRYVEASVSLIKDAEGQPTGFRGIGRDVTERKRAREEKKKLEAQFQAAQRMEAIGTLAGGIAHDFNNLLMAIQGNASLMLSDKPPEHPDYERLKNIEQGVRSGAELTRQLLGFAMGGKYEVKPTDINELIKRSSDMFGRTKKEITIHTKYQEEIWPVGADQGQIEQVLLNLYVNAWQAMPGGGQLYLETENVTLDDKYVQPFDLKPGAYVKISVTDTGVGMDEKTQQRIFEPFFTTREMGRGTGLGLASVYGIIKNHDGIITIDSTKGEGATFTIFLPASEKEVIKEKELLPAEVLKGTETVLLVDDEDMVLDVGEGILKELGYKVLAARDGREAIEIYKAQKGKIAIVVLDMTMPGMGGGEAYDKLKEVDPTIKVLLSSGYSIDGEATEILERGCNGFIQKPFTMRDLSWRIREILDQE